jgi:hypothetical protein
LEHVEDDADRFEALVDAAAEDDSGGTTLLAQVTKQKSFAKRSCGSNISPLDICKVILLFRDYYLSCIESSG